jgi:GNAT superfamily N-acetyltransferase
MTPEPMSGLVIRPAVAADARGIASVHVATWRAAYRGVFPDAYLAGLSVDEREVRWSAALARGRPELWVAEHEAQIIGWVAFGPSRDTEVIPRIAEIEAFYVLPSCWSTGAGRQLWLAVRQRLKEQDFAAVMLWVLAGNERAMRFYRAAGFAPSSVPPRTFTLAGVSTSDVRYERPL